MGQEIVYCFRCQSRLTGADFEKGAAFRVGGKMACLACAQQILPTLPKNVQDALRQKIDEVQARKSSPRLPAAAPPAETPHPPKPASTTRLRAPESSRRVAAPQVPPAAFSGGRSKMPLVLGIAGGAALLLVVILVVALSGKSSTVGEETVTAARGSRASAEPSSSSSSASLAAESIRLTAARAALDRARAYARSRPDDLAGQIREYERSLLELSGTSLAAEARNELEILRAREKTRLVEDLQGIERQARAAANRGDFKEAVAIWEKERSRHDFDDWRSAAAQKLQEIRNEMDAQFRILRQRAGEAKNRGAHGEAKDIRDRVAKWGVAAYTADLDRLLGLDSGASSSAAETRAVTPDAQAYRARWQKAMGHATQRNYEAAVAELEAGAKAAAQPDLKAEAAADLDLLRRLGSLRADTARAIASLPRWTSLNLEVREKDNPRKRVSGRLWRADEESVELVWSGSADPHVVQIRDFSPESLGELCLQKAGKSGPEDRMALALGCLLEGGVENSVERVGVPVTSVPARFWDYAKVAREAPPAAAPPPSRDSEARRLLSTAAREWPDLAKRGAAIEKYRQLRDDHADSPVYARNRDLIHERSEAGKDYVFGPFDLRGSGGFKPASWPKMDNCWAVDADVPESLARDSYVELEFYALPGTAYRCWVYVGGCCKESFTGYFQGSEVTTADPKTKKPGPAEPGSALSITLPQPSGLRAACVKHAGGKAKREAIRWEWIAVPIPAKYASAGPKKVRILADLQGYSVAYAVVSSTRKSPPKEAEVAEALRPAAAGTAAAGAGTKEPEAWFLIGPFENGFNTPFPPEQKIDLAGKCQTKAGAKGWIFWFPDLHDGGTRASFDFKSVFDPGEEVVAYALTHVKCPSALEARLLVGSDDGVRVWVNGQVVHNNPARRGLKPDEDEVKVQLRAGWNRLLFKVEQGKGDWGLSARLTDPQRKPIPGLEFDALGDLAR